MTWEDPDDRTVIALLRHLPARDVSVRRAERLRARCRIQQQTQTAESTERPRPVWIPATLAGASVLYAIAVVVRAILLHPL
jgi:hypothetical protein